MSPDERPNPGSRRGVRPARPFEMTGVAHLVARIMEAVNYKADDIEAVVKRAQHVEFGLAAEVEFAAIAAWLGRCRIVHGLDQEGFRSLDLPTAGKVPDLFAVIHDHGKSLGVLVEVKTSDDFELTLRPEYLEDLRAYAEMAKHPLLLAWKPRRLGMWILFDPWSVPRDRDGKVSFVEAIKDDLMSALLGDYMIVPKSGAGMAIVLERVGPTTPTEDGFTQKAVVKEAFWQDCEGARRPLPGKGVGWTLLATSEPVQQVTDSEFRESFLSTGESIRAQGVLRSVVGFRTQENERIHWRDVGRELGDLLRCSELFAGLSQSFGPFIQYVFHQEPHHWPTWVPETWKGPSKK
jgi:Holliday junction resolvase